MEAHTELRALVAGHCAAIPRLDDWLPALAMLADACAEVGDVEAAAILDPLLAPYPDRLAAFLYGTAPLGPVARPLGRLAGLLGRSGDALVLLERAVTMSEAIPAPIWAAQAKADLGAVPAQRA